MPEALFEIAACPIVSGVGSGTVLAVEVDSVTIPVGSVAKIFDSVAAINQVFTTVMNSVAGIFQMFATVMRLSPARLTPSAFAACS